MKLDKTFTDIIIGRQKELNVLLRFANEEPNGELGGDVDLETYLILRQIFPLVSWKYNGPQ
jgi:hypothetical protein